jgi:hypothetical protein
LTQLLDRMSHSSGTVVLDRPDYAARAQKVEDLQAEEVDLAEQIAQAAPEDVPALQAKLQQTRDELNRERDGMKADQLFVQIQEKKDELDKAVAAVLEPGISPAESAARAAKVDTINQELQDLNQQLDAERDVIELSPSDVDKLALNRLKIELKRQMEQGTFQGVQLELGDVVMAAWVGGDIDSDLLKICLQMASLGEPHDSTLKKIGERALQIGQVLSMAYPPLAYGLTLGSIVIGSIEEAKQREKEESDDASIVH